MKKKSIFSKSAMGLMMLSLALSSCNKDENGGKYTFTWNGEIFNENGITVDSVQVTDEEDNIILTAKNFKKNKIYFEGQVDSPQLANLVLYLQVAGKSEKSSNLIILEPGNIVMDEKESGIKGTPLNNAVFEFENKLFQVYQDTDSLNAHLRNFVEQNKDNVAGVAGFCNENIPMLASNNLLEELWDKFSPEMKKTKVMTELKKNMDISKKSAEGQKFIDFEAEYEGKVQRLSDYVGKGKLVLVDFWASWCGPCRQEIPNIKAVYEKYGGEKLEVVGVATWDEPEATLQAIKEEGITYPQIINAQQAGSDAYSIQGIPEIILFGPDGTILKRGLRGENIEKAISEALSK